MLIDHGQRQGISERRAYSVDEFARMYGVSRAFIYRLARDGKINISRVEGSSRIFRDELERFESQFKKRA